MKIGTFLPAVAVAAALVAPGAASAVTFSADWSVAANSSDPGLVIETAPGAGSFTTRDLAVGESATVRLFDIWTDETTVNGDDRVAKPIQTSFSFTDPVAGGAISGSTVGESSLFGIFQQGRLTWDGPLTLNFGSNGTGRFTLALTDAIFNDGLFGLDEGRRNGAHVKAKLTYDVAPIPLPAALPMLLGAFGLLGAAARRRGAAATEALAV